MPVHLLIDISLPAGAKVLYGVLLHVAAGSNKCSATQDRLLKLTGFRSHNTLAAYIRALVSSGWLETRPLPSRRLLYILHDPRLEERQYEVTLVRKRLAGATFFGEALMKEWLTGLVDCNDYADGVRPGYLENPLSDKPLEYDRIYKGRVAFEFNGPQHYGPTDLYPDREKVKIQQARDAMKVGISRQHGVELVIVTAEDLSYDGMLAKIGSLLPLRDLDEDDPVMKYLERLSKAYRARALGASRKRADAFRRPIKP